MASVFAAPRCPHSRVAAPQQAALRRAQRGEAERSRRAELELTQQVFFCFQNTHEFFKGRIPQVPEYGELARKRAEAALALFDGVLAERQFLAGERFTIADITALVGLDFGRVVKIRPAPEHKHVARWHAEVSARPSAKA